MKNIGLVVHNFRLNQLTYSLFSKFDGSVNLIGFFEQQSKSPFSPRFATMQLHEAWGFPGPLVATSLLLATKIVDFPISKKKFLYVWDLEWLYNKNEDFLSFASIYQNKNIHLIARNEDHASAIEYTWNRKVSAIVEDFNMEQFKNATTIN